MNICGSCTICSKNYTDKDKIVHPGCGHLFHQRCLEKWFNGHSYCAQCRQQSDKKYIRVYPNFDYGFQSRKSPISLDETDYSTIQLKQKCRNLEKELEITKDNLAEIQAVNLSLQNIPGNQFKFEIEFLQNQLNAAISKLEICQNEKEELQEFISTEINYDKNDNEVQKQFEQILNENEKLTNKISKSKLKILYLEQENGKLKFEAQSRSRNVSSNAFEWVDLENQSSSRNANNVFEWVDVKKVQQTEDSSSSSDDGAKSLQLQRNKYFKQKFDLIKKKTIYNTYGHVDKKLEQMSKALRLKEDQENLLLEKNKNSTKTKKNKKK